MGLLLFFGGVVVGVLALGASEILARIAIRGRSATAPSGESGVRELVCEIERSLLMLQADARDQVVSQPKCLVVTFTPSESVVEMFRLSDNRVTVVLNAMPRQEDGELLEGKTDTAREQMESLRRQFGIQRPEGLE